MSAVKVVKVHPYPFPAQIVKNEGAPPLRGSILKLTEIGFLLKVSKDLYFKVGENQKIEFDLPLSDRTIRESVKVIKTYHAFSESTSSTGLQATAPAKGDAHKTHDTFYTIELHFRNLSDSARSEIQKFIQKINQK